MIFVRYIACVQADFLSIICGGTSSWHSYVPRLTKHPGNVVLVESSM